MIQIHLLSAPYHRPFFRCEVCCAKIIDASSNALMVWKDDEHPIIICGRDGCEIAVEYNSSKELDVVIVELLHNSGMDADAIQWAEKKERLLRS
jgi:hypothetical protein